MPDERLQKLRRLLKPADFQRVFACAKRSGDRYFTVLRADEAAPVTCGRIGLAVSKKTDKRAVVRNRIKRTIRESFRQTANLTDDYVVISKAAAATATPAKLRASLSRHWDTLRR